MKSTPEQTARRRELKTLVDRLGNLAWEKNPTVAPHAVVQHKNSSLDAGSISYDEFFVFEKTTSAIPALATKGKIFLRFRRRVTKDRRYEALWHVWEPAYAATKPASVDELLPIIKALVSSMEVR